MSGYASCLFMYLICVYKYFKLITLLQNKFPDPNKNKHFSLS